MHAIEFTTVALSVLASLSGSVSAASIAWNTPANISGDANVSTQGTLTYAYNVGGSTEAGTTVNTVPFTAFPIPTNTSSSTTVGNVSIQETSGPTTGGAIGGSTAAPYTNLSASYRGLLNQLAFSGITEALQVTMGGLTVGQSYQLQVWSNVSAFTAADLQTQAPTSLLAIYSDGAGHTATLNTNTTNTIGGVGQYTIGTFTATTTSQVFTVSGGGGYIEPFGSIPSLNGLQLRAVPEPMSLSMIGLAGMTLMRRRPRSGK